VWDAEDAPLGVGREVLIVPEAAADGTFLAADAAAPAAAAEVGSYDSMVFARRAKFEGGAPGPRWGGSRYRPSREDPGGMEGRVERGGPGVRVFGSGEGSSCPGKGCASLVELLGGNVGRKRYTRVREELLLLLLVWDVDFRLSCGTKFGEGRS
jgi:hypothetical protein